MEFDVNTPVLSIREGNVVTNSRDVAAYFEKRHDHVIRDIRHLLNEAPEVVPNFGEFKINDLTGPSTSHFEMTRDGFTLLAMGFTGPKALKFKIAYIAQFNAMEEELRRRPSPSPTVSIPDAREMEFLRLARQIHGERFSVALWGALGIYCPPGFEIPQRHDLFSAAANQNLPKAA